MVQAAPALPALGTATAVVASVLLAGCLGAPASEVVPAPITALAPDLLDLLAVDHDHTDATLHVAASPNLVGASFHDLALDGVVTDGNTALDVVDGWAVLGATGATSGFVLVDVHDPAAPVVVSRFLAPNTYGADVKFNADASLVFLATQWLGDPTSPTTLARLDPTRATEGPTVFGVYVVDVSDKANPVLESFLPVSRGVHSLHYHEIGGEPYVLMCTYHFINLVAGSEENPVATKVVIGRLDAGPDGARRIVPVGEFTRNLDPAVLAARDGRYFPHELSVSESPIDGKTYAWLSYWDEGLIVLDLSIPSEPKVAGQWKGFEPGDGSIHYAATFPQLIHGTQVTIAGPEWLTHDSSGHWWALDTTDLSDIKTLGFWTLPGAPAFDANYRFSPHNFDLVGTTVVAANYHGGIWIWDVERLVRHFGSGSTAAEPEANATMSSSVRIPLVELLHGESDMDGHADLVDVLGWYDKGHPPRSSYFGGESPLVWAVVVRDGHLLYSDMDSGLGVVRWSDVAEDAQGMFLKGHEGHE